MPAGAVVAHRDRPGPQARSLRVPVCHPVRGVLQLVAALVCADLLVEIGRPVATAGPLDLLVAACLTSHLALFLVSTAYHCVPWPAVSKARMQRLDHSMIYCKIAASIGPLAWLAFEPEQARWWIAAGWTIAALGIAQKAFLPSVDPRVSSVVQVFQGSLLLPILLAWDGSGRSQVEDSILVASLCYGLGAICFLLERPRLWPGIFGFHELFHVLVVLGSLSLGSLLCTLMGYAT